MILYQLKCPGCGATLNVEDDTVDTMYCKYCGSKILLDGQSDAAINAKANIIMHRDDTRYKIQEATLEHETKRMEKKEDSKIIIIALISIPIAFVLAMFALKFLL